MLITLTTDFGLRDPFVAVMKGQILMRLPDARIIDVTHDIASYSPCEAGFWLSRAYRYFPSPCVHVAVVDPGVGTSRGILAVDLNQHVFLAPDNGLLAPLVEAAGDTRIHRVDLPQVSRACGLSRPSSTFHGRDIFAPLAAELAAGRLSIDQLGPQVHNYERGSIATPRVLDGEVLGQIVTIDHFGNLISNIDASFVQPLGTVVIEAGGRRMALQATYGEASAGEAVALVNSFGLLEIAIVQGDAARTMGLKRGDALRVARA